jgi:hypothetical protein
MSVVVNELIYLFQLVNMPGGMTVHKAGPFKPGERSKNRHRKVQASLRGIFGFKRL